MTFNCGGQVTAASWHAEMKLLFSFSREQATVEKKMFNGFVQSTTSTSGRGTKFKTELMRVECLVSRQDL